MKKKILGIILALCLIIGMLPMAVMAAAPTTVKCRIMQDGVDICPVVSDGGAAVYCKVGADGKVSIDGNKDDYNLKFAYSNGVLDITMNNANFACTLANYAFFQIGYDMDAEGYDFATQINLIGENVIGTGSNNYITINGTQGTVITGEGSLEIAGKPYDKGVLQNKGGDLTIKDTTVKMSNEANWDSVVLYMMAGNLIIDNAKVEIFNNSGDSCVWFGGYRELDPSTDRGVTIKNNADVHMVLSTDPSIGHWQHGVIACNKPVVIENSNVLLEDNCWCKVGTVTPELKGSYEAIYRCRDDEHEDAEWKTYETTETFEITPGFALPNGCESGLGLAYLKVTHTHAPEGEGGDCTVAGTCACGYEFTAQAAHVPAEDDGDCTTAILCANEGCTHVCTEAEEAHVYTDNADASCDNDGCEHTRTIEGTGTGTGTGNGTNGNPQTGDNAILTMFVVLMMASAAAFVFTKKKTI